MVKRKQKESSLTIEERLEAALVPEDEQPYEVPENWCWTYVNKVATVIMGQSPDGKSTTDDDSETPLIGGAADMGELYPIISRYTKHPTKLSTDNDLILCIRATLGKPIYSDGIYCLGRGVAAIRSDVISKELLRDFYLAFEQYLYDNATGTTFAQVTGKVLENMPLPLPPLTEQHRIVERIERLFSQLDEARDKAQEALEGFELRRTKTIRNAFEGKYTTEWRRQHGYKIEDWENLTLNDVAEYKKGPFGSSITKAMFVPKGDDTYKVYEQGNAIRKTLAYGHYYISKEKYQELKGFAIQGGDIIISCAGTIGEVYRLPDNCEPGVINQALMRVRLFDNITERFFVYYFGEVLKGDVIDNANGTAMNNIPPFKIMKAMQIKLPSIEEQDAIVRFLDATIEKEQRVIDELENTLDEIELIRKTILMKAFRGELGTNNPGDERAVELLKATVESAKETK